MRAVIPVEDRFWAKVNKDGPMHPTLGQCWVWTGGSTKGYGMINRGRRDATKVKACRLSWELHTGPIPDGFCVLHRCDNPPCVRPSHLAIGTRAENNADMYRKNRQAAHCRKGAPRFGGRPAPNGEQNSQSKLTSEQVQEIRICYAAGGITQTALASRFGVDQKTVWFIVHRKTWRHIAPLLTLAAAMTVMGCVTDQMFRDQAIATAQREHRCQTVSIKSVVNESRMAGEFSYWLNVCGQERLYRVDNTTGSRFVDQTQAVR